MQIPATASHQEGGIPYKWLVAIVVIFGIFMSILDSTIVNIAIPHLQSSFGASLDSVQWTLTGYTLAQGVATPLTGFLSDRLGLKRFYLLSLTGFTVGSALCGLAWSLPVLIAFRILQGATGAFLMPLSMTMLYREFPPQERGTAMGFLGIPILLAPAFGPTLGGYIVTFASWQLIFYINVPIGIVGLLLGAAVLREVSTDKRTSFDVPGFIFSASGLACLLYGLSDASNDGWGSIKVISFLAAGTLLLIIFIAIELSNARQGKTLLLDIRVFGNRSFTTSSLASILVTFALFGGLFLIPVYLQNLRGLSAYQAGLILLPQAFASMVTMLLGGRLVDKFGVRAVVIPGLILMAIAMWLLTGLSTDMPFFTLQLLLILRSLSLGLCMQPLNVSALAEIEPHRLPQATGVSTTLRFVASSLGVALIATTVQNQDKVHLAHLAERVTADSPLGQFIIHMQAALVAQGHTLNQAYATALAMVDGMIQKQAYVLAIQDAFWLSLALAILAIIAACFVGGSKRKAAPEQQHSQAESDEAAQAREEAMLAV
ncbi:MAG: DHA2 family efflux MFS transporter permease subunit [Ktedonobacteraceae bacterium]|nr:DHA2 family efflux MFS transporter permease subunit [Ktedonobacteraceae bacterium]MBO0792571.1 DHA2 family efflux MFS transporter permease subunit [Ktedonobacteraceae bacterium]